MPNFIIAYHGGRDPETPEQGAAQRSKWQAWIAGLGAAAVNPGTPLRGNQTVTSDGVADTDGDTRLTGYSVVAADDLAAAIEIALACPFLDLGTLEVAEVLQMG